MKEKKPTMRDVADMAGVSVATVSYILSGKQVERISEPTRRKVLQIVNLLDYRPSYSAQSLATGHSRLVGVVFGALSARYLPFAGALCAQLSDASYRMVMASAKQADGLDAIVLVGQRDAFFHELREGVFCPILCVDMQPGDWLFYQICDDYARIFAEANALWGGAPYVTVLPAGLNEAYEAYLRHEAPGEVLIYTDMPALRALFAALPHERLLLLGPDAAWVAAAMGEGARCAVIADAGSLLPEGMPCIALHTQAKAEAVVRCMESAIRREKGLPHDIRV